MRISKLLGFLLGFSATFRLGVEGEEGAGGNAEQKPVATQSKGPEVFSREYVQELREENKAGRLSNAELKAALKERDEKLTAAEAAANERIANAEKAANARIMKAELKAAAVRAGLVDMDALDYLPGIDKVKLLDDGTVEGADALFEGAKKAKPHLFGAASVGSTSKTPDPKPGTPPDVRKMSREEYAKAKREASRR